MKNTMFTLYYVAAFMFNVVLCYIMFERHWLAGVGYCCFWVISGLVAYYEE